MGRGGVVEKTGSVRLRASDRRGRIPGSEPATLLHGISTSYPRRQPRPVSAEGLHGKNSQVHADTTEKKPDASSGSYQMSDAYRRIGPAPEGVLRGAQGSTVAFSVAALSRPSGPGADAYEWDPSKMGSNDGLAGPPALPRRPIQRRWYAEKPSGENVVATVRAGGAELTVGTHTNGVMTSDREDLGRLAAELRADFGGGRSLAAGAIEATVSSPVGRREPDPGAVFPVYAPSWKPKGLRPNKHTFVGPSATAAMARRVAAAEAAVSRMSRSVAMAEEAEQR